ncbi:hypothetical protein [Caulobacter vibrioides]|uniref:hypothetical protein n=1 Tax=Caulobacter vibrioides TaxID=155892 RepID=UPI000BB46B21|nr:hypothetical protein [Caulobacter vibrioides]ATC25189.1 hypothetical protein CA608_11955 [Caulobacter vibrioides]PLR13960.1 hypothetical protein CVUC_05260 [Caulobacter vibrioides]
MKVEKARIGSGQGYIWTGAAVFALAGFLAMAASGGAAEALPLAIALATLGAGLVALGFWKGLFNKIELRLIDIQVALTSPGSAEAPATKPAGGEPSSDYLG